MLPDVLTRIVHYLEWTAFVLFQLALFIMFVRALYRLVRREWKR